MPPRCPTLQGTLTPFLYPSLLCLSSRTALRLFSSISPLHQDLTTTTLSPEEHSNLNPPPTSYSRNLFLDHATITIHSGSGGHGCISFLREKYISAGPANGGDGGTGGNVYIQAVRGETSLHKLARRNILRAGRGKNGQGKTQGGERGEDVIIQVPVGTVVREVERVDPLAMEEQRRKLEAGGEDSAGGEENASASVSTRGPWKWNREKWLLYPALTPEDIRTAEFPSLPRPRASALASAQVPGPISLDLSVPMDRPLLLAAGAVGGLGNPHFVTKTVPRPKFATKGAEGMQITLALELKLLADVGLVGLPNAGKSTLLRSISSSKARIGDWAFTTLQPNIGTVVLDDYKGRPKAGRVSYETGEPRTGFTVADIPGLVEGAHLDRGLGISFLRHVERARVLAFVIDLSNGDAVGILKGLWNEVGAYERMKIDEEEASKNEVVNWSPFSSGGEERIVVGAGKEFGTPMKPETPKIALKPWFVVATKADLEGTEGNFERLIEYVESVRIREVVHPSGQGKGRVWDGTVEIVPVSAINGHGVERITECVVELLDG